MKKRAQGLPLNVIVIAILVLLVLVVLSVLFLSNVAKVPKTIRNCGDMGYQCLQVRECSDESSGVYTREVKDAFCLNEDGSKNTRMKCCTIGG